MNTKYFHSLLLEIHETIHRECNAEGVTLLYLLDTETRLGNFIGELEEFANGEGIDCDTPLDQFRLVAKDGARMLKDIARQMDDCHTVALKALKEINDADGDGNLAIKPLMDILETLRGDAYREQVTALVNADKGILQAMAMMNKGKQSSEPTAPSSDDPRPAQSP